MYIDGRRLAALRRGKKISQQAIADQLMVNASTVRRWERGQAAPSTRELFYLASVLDCGANYLLGVVDDPRRVGPYTSSEIDLIYCFRAVSHETREMILSVARDAAAAVAACRAGAGKLPRPMIRERA